MGRHIDKRVIVDSPKTVIYEAHFRAMELELEYALFRKDYFYIMHLSYNGAERERLWNYAKDNRVIGLDAPRHVKGNWLDVRETAKKSLGSGWVRQFDVFCDVDQKGIHKGDLVMVLNGMMSVLGIARVTESAHIYDKKLSASEIFFDHARRIEWLRKYEYASLVILPKLLEGFSNTLSRVPPKSPRWPMFTNLDLK